MSIVYAVTVFDNMKRISANATDILILRAVAEGSVVVPALVQPIRPGTSNPQPSPSNQSLVTPTSLELNATDVDLVFKASKQASSEFDVSSKSQSKADSGGASGNFLNYQEFVVCLKLIAEKHFRVKVEKKPKAGSRGGRSKKGGIPSQGKSRQSNTGNSSNNNQLSTSAKSFSTGGDCSVT